MDSLAPIIKSVVAAIIPFLVTSAVALAARYDVVIDADALNVFIAGVITAVLTGVGVYASPANKPADPAIRDAGLSLIETIIVVALIVFAIFGVIYLF